MTASWFTRVDVLARVHSRVSENQIGIVIVGGIGSTRWGSHRKALTVESSYTIDLMKLTKGIWGRRRGVVSWSAGGITVEQADYSFVEVASMEQPMWLVLRYTVSDEPVELPIKITSPPGRQRAFPFIGLCPAVQCQRPIYRLHRPPDERYFLCRNCHGLVYHSSQTWGCRT